MEAALPVGNVPYDASVEVTGDVSNMTAEEYLSWVRDQSAKMPTYFRASNITLAAPVPQTKYMPQVQNVPVCDVDLLPSIDWERNMIHDFSELRMIMYKKSLDESTKERKVTVPQMKDIDGWLAFCLGVKEADEVVASTEVGAEKWRDQLLPVSTEVDDKEKAIRKRKRELAKTLGIAVELKCEEEEGEVIEDGESVEVEPEERIAVEDRKDVSSDVEGDADSDVDDAPQYHSWDGSHSVNPALSLILQFDQVLTQKLLAILIDYLDAEDEVSGATPSLSPLCGQWLYSLLARVEKPLHRDVVASIRQLYRRCCVLRNQLPLKHQDTASEDFQLDLAALNTLISISGYYFGQGEYYSSFEPIIEASYNDNTSDPSQRNLLLEGSSDEEEDGWEEEDTNAMEEDEAGEVEELEESAPKRRAF